MILKNLIKELENAKNNSLLNENHFWIDEHISKKILEQQLDPFYEGGSRLHSEIDESIEFITRTIEISKYKTLIDLGCGPGLYTSIFSKYIKNVIGIDISKTSLDYAIKQSKINNLNIKYILADFITMDTFPKSDVVLLVYSIFGSLLYTQRKNLLAKTNKCLPKNGYLIFDVLSENNFLEQCNKTEWTIENGGFWSKLPYLLLKQTEIIYSQKTILNKYVILDEAENIKSYIFRDSFFNITEIEKILQESGFIIDFIYCNFTGKVLSNTSKGIAIIARKICNIPLN